MPPTPAKEQVRRLLVMIPWLAQRGRVSLDELASAFNISVAQAEADVNQATMIAVPPYAGGCYVDVFLDEDGYVDAFAGQHLRRPPQLSAAQGFALLASAKALIDYQPARGTGPLASALSKLESVLGDPSVVDVDLRSPPLLSEVREAVHLGRQLHLTYYAAWRDEVTERDVDPQVVYQRHGRWYVQAFCHRAGDVRRFRVDRIRALTATGVTFEPARVAPPDDVWDPGPDADEVVLDLPLSARWVIEAYPVEWTETDGRLRVTMRVLGTAWLERLLLRVGPSGVVVSPSSFADVGRAAAARLLAAYEGTS